MLPDPTDKPECGTLPDPNLNPLSNPVLGQHMGRWAEVYFTTPPEKRREAAEELPRPPGATSQAGKARGEKIRHKADKPHPSRAARPATQRARRPPGCRQ